MTIVPDNIEQIRRNKRVGKLAKTRKYTTADLGKMFSLTRQRISVILIEQGIHLSKRESPEGYDSLDEAARRFCYSNSTIRKKLRLGQLSGIKVGSRTFISKKATTIERECVECGKPIPRGRAVLCSEKCHIARDRKLRARVMWRKLHRAQGKTRFPPSCDYLKERGQKI